MLILILIVLFLIYLMFVLGDITALIPIAVFVAYIIYKSDLDNKVEHYKMSDVDVNKMVKDSGENPEYIKRKLVKGEYDKDKK